MSSRDASRPSSAQSSSGIAYSTFIALMAGVALIVLA
jgi:hypothetical protein